MSLKQQLQKRLKMSLNIVNNARKNPLNVLKEDWASLKESSMIIPSKLYESLNTFRQGGYTRKKIINFILLAIGMPFFIIAAIAITSYCTYRVIFNPIILTPLNLAIAIPIAALVFVVTALFDTFKSVLPKFSRITSKNVSSKASSAFFSDPNGLEKNIKLIAKEKNKMMMDKEYAQLIEQKQKQEQAFKSMLTKAAPLFKDREEAISEAEFPSKEFKAGIVAGNNSAIARREKKLAVAEALLTTHVPAVAATPVAKNKRGMLSFSLFSCTSKPKTEAQPSPQLTSSNRVRSRIRKLFG